MKTLQYKLMLSVFVVTFIAGAFPIAVAAQNIERISQREIQRRQAALGRGKEALARAKVALVEKNFGLARDAFRTAVESMPDAAVSGESYAEALDGLCESAVKFAEQRIAEGQFDEAESIVREAIDERYNPDCKAAAELLAHLTTPGYYNRTISPKFIAKVEEVKALLAEAEGYYESGRYDLAFKKYEQVLVIDPYNTAARRGEEKIDLTKYQYNKEAYNRNAIAPAMAGRKSLGGTGPPTRPDGWLGYRFVSARCDWHGADHATSSTASSFRESNFAMRAFAKRLIFFINKRSRMILLLKARRESILSCALCRSDKWLHRRRPSKRHQQSLRPSHHRPRAKPHRLARLLPLILLSRRLRVQHRRFHLLRRASQFH